MRRAHRSTSHVATMRTAAVVVLCLAPIAAFVPSRWNPAATSRTAPMRMSEEGGALVPVNEENIGAGASTLGAVAGVAVGGPVVGAVGAAVVNYVSKQDNELSDVARGIGKVALDVFNFATKLNSKYDLTDKAGSAALSAIDKVKEKDAEGTLDKIEDAIATTTDKLSALNDEYDLVGKGKQVLWVAGDLSEKAIVKGIELNEEYDLVNKAGSAVKDAASKAQQKAAASS